MLENLQPAEKVDAPKEWKPAVEFDGTNGEAITGPLIEKPDFSAFLADAGFDETYEVVGTPRTSRWQRYDGEWLTSYKFQFRRVVDNEINLPLLYAQAKKAKQPILPIADSDKAFVIVAADFQVGKVASRGNTQNLIARIFRSYNRIEKKLKSGKYEKIVIIDAGDIVENFDNAASSAQLQSNDLSIMSQVDLAASLMWDLVKMASKYAPVTYASVGSNHCQWRVNKQAVGKPGVDDWGIFITKQLRKLAHEVGLPVKFLVPAEYDESLAYDVFDDKFHVLGIAHGHQASRPDGIPNWLDKQVAGLQAIHSYTIAITGHFHHTRIQQLGQAHNGGSRWWVQGSTQDNGSDWYRLTSGADSTTGMTCFELNKGELFNGTVYKL